MTYKHHRIRDPLHNLIEFPADDFDDAMWRVIQTRPFQRLRRIKQLGFSELVYPGATHSRFAHSIGVFHTARKLMEVVKRHLGSAYDHPTAEQALAAALVHDLGHGPYSHAFENVGKRLNLGMDKHETVSARLIRDEEVSEALKPRGSGFASDVANIIADTTSRSIYAAVVSSQFDADRLDYMRRDRLMTGTYHGVIDFEWLLSNLKVGKVPQGADEEEAGDIDTFVLGPKALHAAEAYLLGLYQLYATVYLHKATRGAEKLFTELLVKVVELARNDSIQKTGLSQNHPLIRFAKEPNDLKCLLALDDSVISGALSMMVDAKDPLITNFSMRLRNRKLFKCIDIRESLNQQIGLAGPEDSEVCNHCTGVAKKVIAIRNEQQRIDALAEACKEVEKRLIEWEEEDRHEIPQILLDKPEPRSIYKRSEESKGPLEQIMMIPGGGNDKPVDVASISQVIKAVDPFQVFRVYFDRGDHKAKERIDNILKEEAKRCRC
jgi:hypothetical protein